MIKIVSWNINWKVMKMSLKIVFCLFISFSKGLAGTTFEFKRKCGNYEYIIVIDLYTDYTNAKIKQYFRVGKEKKKLFYESETNKMVDASCTNDKDSLFFFAETCFSYDENECREVIYGIYDPKQQKMLHIPYKDKNNSKSIKDILTFVPDYNELYEEAFCCSRKMIE